MTRSTANSPQAGALDIGHRLEERHGIRLLDVIRNDALSISRKRELMTTRLLESLLTDLAQHHEGAQLAAPFDSSTAAVSAILAEAVEVEPNLIFREVDANQIRNYKGRQVYDFVYGLSERLESMARAKTEGQLAAEMVAAGLVSIGVSMGVGTAKALVGGAALGAAVGAGIASIGFATAIGVVAVVLVLFLLFLLLENPKKLLGIVLNDTDEDFVVVDWRRGVDGDEGGDLYMQHGRMERFPQDSATGQLDSPKVQLRKRFFFAPGDPDNFVCAGMFFADKNFGFRGAEGIMVFTSLQSPVAIPLQFAVPYTNDNGANVRVMPRRPNPGSLPSLFRTMYDSRGVRVEKDELGYRVISTVNDPRGGVVALIGSIWSRGAASETSASDP